MNYGPGVKVFREPKEVLRGNRHHSDNSLVKSNEDWHLDKHGDEHRGSKATQWVYPGLLIELHGLLLEFLRVFGILLLYLLQLWL